MGDLEQYFLIAEITSVYNDDGYVRIRSYSDFPDRFFDINDIFIEVFNEKQKFIVEDVERIEDFFILKFRNFNSFEHVEFLIGAPVFVDSENLVKLDEETHFVHDLIGCKVFFNYKFFGNIEDVMHLTSNDVYVVKLNEKEFLMPAISDLIKSIDIDRKIVYLKKDFDEFNDDEN